MADAYLRVREFDDSVEVFELDYILSHRGYEHLAHPGVSKQDKLEGAFFIWFASKIKDRAVSREISLTIRQCGGRFFSYL